MKAKNTNYFPLLSSLFLWVSFFLFSPIIHSADLEAGKSKSAMCQGCHGSDGHSQSAQYPSLAGQRALYLQNQLKAFQSGKRISPIMQSMAANLSKQDILNISTYFASRSLEKKETGSIVDKKGKSKVAMCLGCHGSNAQGLSSFPRLAGQQPAYLKKQLLNFKNRTRKGGPMNSITATLSEQDIDEIANYLGNL